LRGEACAGLDGALESDGLESAGEDGVVCAAAAAARNEETKTTLKILFMLDLIRLDLFFLVLILSLLTALPETIIIGCKTARGGVS
jgi:hypothetical protein